MRINILHMSFLYSGGGERVVLKQAKRLRERGHTVRVFAPIVRWEKCFPELLQEIKPERIIPSLPIPLPVRDALAMIASAVLPFRMREMANCDVLLCHSQPSMWLGYRIHGLFGTPYVGYLHQLTSFIHARPADAGSWGTNSDFLVLDRLLGGYSFRRTVTKHLDRLCHLCANHLLFNSAWTRSLFQREYGVTGDVCYPGLDAAGMTGNDETRENMILTASRHYPWKRIDLAFQVLSKLRCKPRLLVVGESTGHTPYLRSIVRQLDLEDRVDFTGFVTDNQLQQFYHHASGYVQTSIHEPFGMCVHPGMKLVTKSGVKVARHVHLNDELMAADGKWHRVKRKQSRSLKDAKLIELRPWAFGTPAHVTPEHPCYAIIRRSRERFRNAIKQPATWVEAKDLRVKDILVYPLSNFQEAAPSTLHIDDYSKGTRHGEFHIPISQNQHGAWHRILNANRLRHTIEITEQLMHLFGIYMAEGSSAQNGVVSFAIAQKEQHLMRTITRSMKDIFGLMCTIRNKKHTLGCEVYACSGPLAHMLSTLFGNRATEKRIPWSWLSMSNQLLRAFLEGLFLGDGYIYKGRRVDFKTSSCTLANQVKFILLKIGWYPFSFQFKRRTSGFLIGSTFYDFRIPLSPSHKRKTGLGTDQIFLPIRKVRKIHYSGPVLDFEMDDASSFAGESVLLHNSPLEAQLAGVPAVVWGDAGVRETVVDGETGFYAKPYDVGDFADKLDTILTDVELWQSMSRAARIVASTFDWETHIDLLESVLDETKR